MASAKSCGRRGRPLALCGLLLPDDIELLDHGLLEELTRFLTERFRDLTRQVRLAPVVVGKCVKDPERRGSELYREPPDGLGLTLYD